MVTPRNPNRTYKPIQPHLIKQWHPTKNGELNPQTTPAASNKKVWWQCQKRHEWEASPNNRQQRGCPYCSNRKILPGYNDLTTINPDIAKQWHPTKNGELQPTMFPPSSAKKIWWQCEKGHEWEATINRRNMANKKGHNGCAVCSGQKVLTGYNDLATINPQLAKLWHPTKNGELTPQQVTYGTDQKAWWTNTCGHEWQEKVGLQSKADRERRTACKICRGVEILPGFNDLATTHPELVKQWHSTKNGDLTPQQMTSGMRQKIWWIDDLGHEWESVIYRRTGKSRSGCPYCVNQKVLKGFNDADSQIPGLKQYWHPTKNGKLQLNQFNGGSNKNFWWQCEKGHEYYLKMAEKTMRIPQWCPICYDESNVSSGEQEIRNLIKKLNLKHVIKDRKTLDGKEIDILLPDHKIGIEFNGIYWHSDATGTPQNYHYNKYHQAKQNNIDLIQIWEDEWKTNKNQLTAAIINKIIPPTLTPTQIKISKPKDNETTYATLDEKAETIATLTIKQSSSTVQIKEYVEHQPGYKSLSLLLEKIIETANPKTVTFKNDNSNNLENILKPHGFKIVNQTHPEYKIIKGKRRINPEEDSGRRIKVWDVGYTYWEKKV